MSPAIAAGRTRQAGLFEGLRREAGERSTQARRERRPCTDGRRVTLEQYLDAALGDLLTTGTTDCPACHAPMEPLAAGGGHCSACGTTLA